MKIKSGILLVLFCLTLFWAYRSFKYQEEVVIVTQPIKYKDSISFTLERQIHFKMDSVSEPSNIQCLEYFNDKGDSGTLTFLNSENNTIYQYSLNDFNLLRRIPLNEFGYTLGDKIQGYHFLSSDSALIYSYTKMQISLLSFSHGKLLNKRIADRINDEISNVYPYICTGAPILYSKKNNDVILSGCSSDEGGTYMQNKQRNVIAKFNIQSGDVTFSLKYPQFYWSSNWGGAGGFRRTWIDQVDGNNAIVSFMADNFVTLYNFETGAEKRYYAGSKYCKAIKSLPYTPNYYDFISSNNIYKYYCENFSYTIIKYDPYNQLYYRIGNLPNFNLDARGPHAENKQKTIIILNKNFTKVGEVLLPLDVYNAFNLFVDKEGLYIQLNDKNNDVLSFQHFAITPLHKN